MVEFLWSLRQHAVPSKAAQDRKHMSAIRLVRAAWISSLKDHTGCFACFSPLTADCVYFTVHSCWQASKANQDFLEEFLEIQVTIWSCSFHYDGFQFHCSHLRETWNFCFTVYCEELLWIIVLLMCSKMLQLALSGDKNLSLILWQLTSSWV